jgi:YVTN family beta-propeller protein
LPPASTRSLEPRSNEGGDPVEDGGTVAGVVVDNTLEFRILGPLEVLGDAGPVHVGSAKQRALLGVLLLHANEPVSTSRIVDALWGESPPATADKLVQGYVHALRKQLGDGVVQTRSPGYAVALQGRTLDLAEFERLLETARSAPARQAVEFRRRGLALWRGGALAGVELEGHARHEAARLDELRLSTQIEQFDARLALGQHTELVGELETLVAAHPYQERLHAHLMLALYRSGRQADALEHYRSFRRALDDELGLQPGAELRELEAAILRQDPDLSAPASSVLAEPAAAKEPLVDDAAPEPAPRRRRLVLSLGVAGLVLAVAALAAFVLRDGEPAPIIVAPNSVAVIDAETNLVVDTVQVGIRPGPIASEEGAVWVGNLDDRSLTRIDIETREVLSNLPVPATPHAIAFGGGAVWVVNGRLGSLYRVDPTLEAVSDPIQLADRSISFSGGGVAVDGGSVWTVFGDSTLARVNASTREELGAGEAGGGPSALAVGFDSVWVANSTESSVQRFSPSTFESGAIAEYPVGRSPAGLAAGEGAIWVTNREDDYVTRLDAAVSSSPKLPIPVGGGPIGIAVGDGAVWVANSRSGTVSRIDPDSNEVVKTIELGNAATGVVVVGNTIWVTVQAP